MIERYTRPEMGRLWSDDARLQRWLDVEVAALAAWETAGKVPAGTADHVRANARIDKARMAQIEAEVNHDVAAFVSQVAETCGEPGRFIHYGLTSYDVVDTAQGIALRDAAVSIRDACGALAGVLKRRAVQHRDTLCMARTHGIHAEPTTFGAKLAGYAFEFARHRDRMNAVVDEVAVGKLAGPVGTYASVPPSVETEVLSAVGLRPEDAPTQIVARDRHASYLSALAAIGTSCERLAQEIRHLARTEVREVQEPFSEGAQKGSSSMPHKRNPWRCERIGGLARLLRGYAHAGWENLLSWHERDMSQSSAERVALADASCVADFALAELTQITDGMLVFPERMRANLDSSHGLWTSQHVLLALIDAGMTRDDAYRIVQSHAMTAWDEARPFIELLKEDDRVTAALPGPALDDLFDPARLLSDLPVVFERLESLDA